MARIFNIRISSGTSLGPYSVYYNTINTNNLFLNFQNNLPATGITLNQLTTNSGFVVYTTNNNVSSVILRNDACTTTFTYTPSPTLTPRPTRTRVPSTATPSNTNTSTPTPTLTCDSTYYDFMVGIQDWSAAIDHKIYVSYTNSTNTLSVREFTDNGFFGNALCVRTSSPAPIVYYYDIDNNYTLAFDSYATNTNICCSNDLTPTPYPTITPEPTPSVYYAYVFAEPQNPEALFELSNYMYNSGANHFFGYGNSGLPQTNDYELEMIMYSKYIKFIEGDGLLGYISRPIDLYSEIRQNIGTGLDAYECTQNQYTFGTIRISDFEINPTDNYFYSIWIPLNGVGGTFNNMTVDVSGYGSTCSGNIYSNDIPSPTLSGINVNVPANAAIPAGIYRVLWSPTSGYLPGALLNGGPIYIKGNSKT